MDRKTLAVVVMIMVCGWTFLGIETAIRMGALNSFMTAPDELVVNGSASPAPNGTVIVVEWHLPRKPLEKLLDGRDLMVLLYFAGIYSREGVSYSLLYDGPVVNLTLYPSGRVVTKNERGYTVWRYDTEDFATLQVEMAWDLYAVPMNVTGGRIELFLPTVNYSRCSVIPVVVVYFHETGGDKVEPSHISTRLPVYLGPDFPISSNETLQTLFSFNISRWVDSSPRGKRGGWMEVRTFNVTLPCERN